MSNNPSGWYPDPSGRPQQRWWDGTAWTDFVSADGKTFVDTPSAAPPAPPTVHTAPAPVAAPTPTPAGAVAAAGGARRSMTSRLAMIAAVSLIVGGGVGYVAGSSGDDDDGGGGGGGGGASAGTLTAPLVQGMAGLDSYEVRIDAVMLGPTGSDRNEMSATLQADKAAKLNHQSMTSRTTSEDDPTGSTSTEESWITADLTCSFDGEEYSSEAANPLGTDFGSLFSGVFDVVIPEGDSELVGDDTIAGVAAERHSFSIKGLGADSGWLVDTNQGEVWVAKDGGYVLKYTMNVAMRSDAQSTESYSLQLTLEFTSVNQPVTIEVPAACPPPDTTS